MNPEKTLILQTGRSVKVLADIQNSEYLYKTELEVLIKEPWETAYHPPIGTCHPKYWKMQKMDREKSRKLQLAYSGLSDKDIRKAIKDLRRQLSLESI